MSKVIKIPGRLESAETGNVVAGADAIMDDVRGKKQVVINNEVDAAILGIAESKQDKLTFDSTPTSESTNPVTSGGVYAADQLLSQAIEAILLLIPSAASALNQLADKSFVNSSIATDTATFRGTYNLVSDLHLGVSATHEQIAAALDALSLTADNNDYAFVQVPNTDTAPTEIAKTERYKFNGTSWAYEYDLNNSGFTSDQWASINSGITQLLVSKLGALPTNSELVAAFAAKQNTLTFDNVPVSGSNNPVKSGGVYSRNAEIVAMITALDAAKQNVLTFDNTPTQNSTNPVTSNGVYVAIAAVQAAVVALDAAKQNVLTFDNTPILGSSNPVTSSGIKTELNRIDGNITTLDNLYQALTQSALVVVQPTDTWPVASPATSTIYRVVDRVNTPPQNYSDYMWNGSAMVLMATYDNAIDDVPTAGSNNLVKSEGIEKAIIGSYGLSDRKFWTVDEFNASNGELTFRSTSERLSSLCFLELNPSSTFNDISVSTNSQFDSITWIMYLWDASYTYLGYSSALDYLAALNSYPTTKYVKLSLVFWKNSAKIVPNISLLQYLEFSNIKKVNLQAEVEECKQKITETEYNALFYTKVDLNNVVHWNTGSINATTGVIVPSELDRAYTIPLCLDFNSNNLSFIKCNNELTSSVLNYYAYDSAGNYLGWGTYSTNQGIIQTYPNAYLVRFLFTYLPETDKENIIGKMLKFTTYAYTRKTGVELIYEKEDQSNILSRKKWAFCGDSFTAGPDVETFSEGRFAGLPKTYGYLIANRNNMLVYADGISGSQMCYIPSRHDSWRDGCFSLDRYKNIPNDVDYITLYFGINDDNYDSPIGTVDDDVNTTFYGAWNIVMKYLIQNHPDAKIGIIVTNGSAPEYTAAERVIAKKFGVSFLDMELDDKIPYFLRQAEKVAAQSIPSDIVTLRTNNFAVNAPSNTHPNAKAHAFESTFIESWLKSL